MPWHEHRGNTHLTSLPLVSVCRHSVNSSSISLVNNLCCSKCIELTYRKYIDTISIEFLGQVLTFKALAIRMQHVGATSCNMLRAFGHHSFCTILRSFGQPCLTCCNMIQHVASVWPGLMNVKTSYEVVAVTVDSKWR